MAVDPLEFRAAMSRFATGVTVLSTIGSDRHEVMTANAVTSVSLHPTLLLASIRADARWLVAVRQSRRFAVNVLAAHHEDLARWCADRARHANPDVVTGLRTRVSPDSGLLLFEEALFAVECSVHSEFAAGDHVVVLGEVTSIEMHDPVAAPLVFFDHRYSTVHSGNAAPRLESVYPALSEVPAVTASR